VENIEMSLTLIFSFFFIRGPNSFKNSLEFTVGQLVKEYVERNKRLGILKKIILLSTFAENMSYS
jgi:hypothetical protein